MTVRHQLPDEPPQVVTIDASGGTFALTYSGQETAALAFDCPSEAVRSALEDLGRVGKGNVTVTGADGGPFELRFGGELVGKSVAVVEADDELLDGTVVVTTLVPSPWD